MSTVAPDPSLLFGQIALSRGFITEQELNDCLRAQKLVRTAGLHHKIGEVMVQKEVITPRQRDAILRIQKEGGKYQKLGPDIELIRRIGSGSMGTVYLGRQISLEREVAVKILAPHLAKSEEFVRRFQREARSAGRLNHPNIVMVHDAAQVDGTWFLIMEYVEGESVRQKMRREGALDENDATQIAVETTRALKHAHDHGLIHRDVKPDNILLDTAGVAKLADLGLGRQLGGEDIRLTTMGVTMGTPHYVSPEQVLGQSDIDGRADIYSLGATLYHMVTNQVPFPGSNSAVIMTQHLNDTLRNPQDLNPDLSDRICHAIARMMAREREDRYLDCDELLADLERIAAGEDPCSEVPAEGSSVVAWVPCGVEPADESSAEPPPESEPVEGWQEPTDERERTLPARPAREEAYETELLPEGRVTRKQQPVRLRRTSQRQRAVAAPAERPAAPPRSADARRRSGAAPVEEEDQAASRRRILLVIAGVAAGCALGALCVPWSTSRTKRDATGDRVAEKEGAAKPGAGLDRPGTKEGLQREKPSPPPPPIPASRPVPEPQKETAPPIGPDPGRKPVPDVPPAGRLQPPCAPASGTAGGGPKLGDADRDGWICLFDGRTLDGWDHCTTGQRVRGFEARDGEIFRPAGLTAASRIDTAKQWADFELRAKVFLRRGYGEINIGTDPSVELVALDNAVAGRWLDVYAKAEGERILGQVDGKPNKEGTRKREATPIRLHCSAPSELRVKDLWLRPIQKAASPKAEPDGDWISIFDGHDWDGWKRAGGAAEILDGAIVARDNADLWYEADWSEFVLTCEIKGGGGAREEPVLCLGLSQTSFGRGNCRVRLVFFIDGDVHVYRGSSRVRKVGAGKLAIGDWTRVKIEHFKNVLRIYQGDAPVDAVDLSGTPLLKGGLYFYANGAHTASIRNIRVRVLPR